MTEETIKSALTQVKYPGFSRDIVAFGLVKDIALDGNDVEVTISIQTRDEKIPQQVFKDAQDALSTIPNIGTTRVNIDVQNPDTQGEGQQQAGFR